jgi:hypothetical protein
MIVYVEAVHIHFPYTAFGGGSDKNNYSFKILICHILGLFCYSTQVIFFLTMFRMKRIKREERGEGK